MTTHLSACNCDQCLLVHMQAPSAAERQKGWEMWYQRDSPQLLAFIERRCRAAHCPDSIEDILQETFIIGFRNISSGRYLSQGGTIYAYLIGIVKHLLAALLRLQSREAIGSDSIEEEAFTGLDLDDIVYLEELCLLIRDAHIQQSTLQQHIITALYGEGKSSEEVALELGKTPANTRVIAHRAVADMVKYLEDEHHVGISGRAIRTVFEVL